MSHCHFKTKATPDVRIQWTTYTRQPLAWSIIAHGGGSDIDFEYGPDSGNPFYKVEVEDPIFFSAYADFMDTGATPVAWAWSFGDGRRAFGEQVTHTYTSPVPTGTQVVLTVTDNKGRKHRARQTMYIEDFSIRPMLLDYENLLVVDPTP
jgi:PKD repeat protein